MARELSNSDLVMCAANAEDEVLNDVESFANWLSEQCCMSTPAHCRIGYVPRDAVHFANFVASLDVPQLVALSLYPIVTVSGAASMELRERYLKDASTVAYVNRLAADKEASL